MDEYFLWWNYSIIIMFDRCLKEDIKLCSPAIEDKGIKRSGLRLTGSLSGSVLRLTARLVASLPEFLQPGCNLPFVAKLAWSIEVFAL